VGLVGVASVVVLFATNTQVPAQGMTDDTGKSHEAICRCPPTNLRRLQTSTEDGCLMKGELVQILGRGIDRGKIGKIVEVDPDHGEYEIQLRPDEPATEWFESDEVIGLCYRWRDADCSHIGLVMWSGGETLRDTCRDVKSQVGEGGRDRDILIRAYLGRDQVKEYRVKANKVVSGNWQKNVVSDLW